MTKKIPPGALITAGKRRTKFVRIGRRKHNFVRIGKMSEKPDVAAVQPVERGNAAPDKRVQERISRKVKFVRIGRKPIPFVRIGKTFSPNENSIGANTAAEASLQRMRKRPLKFVRIGRSSGVKRSGSQNRR